MTTEETKIRLDSAALANVCENSAESNAKLWRAMNDHFANIQREMIEEMVRSMTESP